MWCKNATMPDLGNSFQATPPFLNNLAYWPSLITLGGFLSFVLANMIPACPGTPYPLSFQMVHIHKAVLTPWV